MPRLVTKFKYLKPGGGGKSVGGYARYIATREGVEKLDDTHRYTPATKKQQSLIEKILRDFPETRGSQEYEDFQREQTVGNASEFISMAIEENMEAVASTKTYADYIATRPRAERFGSHGLFTDDGVQVQLSKVSQELNAYTGNVYTAILSLKREDAARLGFDHGSRWRDFLRGQTQTLSENLKIPMNHLRWYAAFHNEGHHPHVHLIAYSTVPGEGRLSTQGVEKMRSVFAREIFSQELLFTYQQQTEYRDQLRLQSRENISEIVAEINAGTYRNPRIEELLIRLADRLSRTTGKKVYGYLMRRVYGYLIRRRGINKEVLDTFAYRGLVYESADYHNAVFVGTDREGKPRHIHKHSTAAQGGFKGNAPGSEPEFSFHWIGGGDTLFLFEAPIDMLSFISMHKQHWKSSSYVAACGVSDKVLWQTLKDRPYITKVCLCLDNDEIGQKAAQRISKALADRNICNRILVPTRKDWNEDLLFLRKEEAK